MIVACLKWTAHGPEPVTADERFAGVSAADRAALELALRIGTATGDQVVAASVGPAAAEVALRDAVACGATRAVRVALDTAATSYDVAIELASVCRGAQLVLCGDTSSDRGSGSVPAFLAHELGVAQALGLVALDETASPWRGVRRLDGGRREVLRVDAPCVVSVEGSAASLRRAPLRAALTAAAAAIEVLEPRDGVTPETPALVTPFRPRARVLPAPVGADALARVRSLTDLGGTSGHGETVTLDPTAAARRIMEALREWGYVS